MRIPEQRPPRSHGKERSQKGQGSRLDAGLRARLIAEARRLGAGDEWAPEAFDIRGEE